MAREREDSTVGKGERRFAVGKEKRSTAGKGETERASSLLSE